MLTQFPNLIRVPRLAAPNLISATERPASFGVTLGELEWVVVLV